MCTHVQAQGSFMLGTHVHTEPMLMCQGVCVVEAHHASCYIWKSVSSRLSLFICFGVMQRYNLCLIYISIYVFTKPCWDPQTTTNTTTSCSQHISKYLSSSVSHSPHLSLSFCHSAVAASLRIDPHTHTHTDTHFIWITALLRYLCNNLNNCVWSSVLCRAGPDREGFSPFNSKNVRGCRCPLPTGAENSSLLSPAWLQWYVRHCPKCWFIALITLLGYCPGKDSTTSHIQHQGAVVCMSVLVGCFLCTGLSIKHVFSYYDK